MTVTTAEHDALFEEISDLVMCHSPSGWEQEVDALLLARFRAAGLEPTIDGCGNIIARIAGRGRGCVAITAHKDEIGAIVTRFDDGGRLKLRNLGGSFPWIYGEGVMDILGDLGTIPAILSFGSRHVAHGAPQLAFAETAPLKWSDAWLETHRSAAELATAGVRPGSRIVIGKHRKRPIRIGDHIASYALDNKAALAVLLDLARTVREPEPDVVLVATTKEEVGAIGGLYLTQHRQFDAMIALEIVPVAEQYDIAFGPNPALLAEDGMCVYDDALGQTLLTAAGRVGIALQTTSVSGFGSDASIAMRQGHLARGACLGFPAQNTHGFEIADLTSVARCSTILREWCAAPNLPLFS